VPQKNIPTLQYGILQLQMPYLQYVANGNNFFKIGLFA